VRCANGRQASGAARLGAIAPPPAIEQWTEADARYRRIPTRRGRAWRDDLRIASTGARA
jgi:hypothetical protein